MEETVNKLVNLGIGTVKTLDEQAKEIATQAETKINELIASGETASDNNSAAVKSFVADALKGYKELEQKVLTFTEDLQSQIAGQTEEPAKPAAKTAAA